MPKNNQSSMNFRFQGSHSGFTLIELLVVLFIIGLLTGILLPNFLSARQRGRDALRKEDMQSIKSALRLYYNDNQGYPAGDVFSFGGAWSGYMAVVPQDPLGGTSSYHYCVDDDGEAFIVWAHLENGGDQDIAESALRCPVSLCGDTNPQAPDCVAEDNCYFACAN